MSVQRLRKYLFNLVPSPKSTCNNYQIFRYFYQNAFFADNDCFEKNYTWYFVLISFGNKCLDLHQDF